MEEEKKEDDLKEFIGTGRAGRRLVLYWSIISRY